MADSLCGATTRLASNATAPNSLPVQPWAVGIAEGVALGRAVGATLGVDDVGGAREG